jgi:hypothetical protein
MLAHGVALDAIDEYCCLGQNKIIINMKRLVCTIQKLFKPMYLNQPTQEDLECQLPIM